MDPRTVSEEHPQNSQSRELFLSADSTEHLEEQMMDMDTEVDDETDEEL